MRRAFCIYILASRALAQIQQAPPPADSSSPAGTGSIEGIVFDAATHAPLGKAQVTVSGGIAAPLTAVTGASGRFAFRELAAGSYWLNVSKPGYSPPESVFGPDTNTGVVLGAGEERKGVEIVLLP